MELYGVDVETANHTRAPRLETHRLYAPVRPPPSPHTHAAAAAVPDDDIGSESVDVLGLGCPSEGDDLSDDDSDDAH